MLRKQERLSRSEFQNFFNSGRKTHSPHLTLVYAPYPTLHAAVVVGKKVSKKSPVRNTIRRRVYGILYRELKLNKKTGVYIVLVKPSYQSLGRIKQQAVTKELIGQVLKTA